MTVSLIHHRPKGAKQSTYEVFGNFAIKVDVVRVVHCFLSMIKVNGIKDIAQKHNNKKSF